jgi:TolB-like protein
VFVCYAHEDSRVVYPDISWLDIQGVNIWYDEGIIPGEEWTEGLASAIQGCTRVLFFVTPKSVASRHCRRELNFAQAEGREILAVHLEPTDVPAGLRLSLNDRQAILKYELSGKAYRDKLLAAVAGSASGSFTTSVGDGPARHKPRIGVALTAIAVVVVAVGAWWLGSLREKVVSPSAAPESVDTVSPHRQRALRNSIAVLPFENLSPDPDNAYFAAGIHEEVLNQLVRIGDLAVIARSSVLRYANDPKPASEIAKDLNVTSVLEGSVRFADDRVRITAKLVDAHTNSQLWSHAYEAPLDEIFSLQLNMANRITTALRAELSSTEQEAIGRQLTESPAAHALYLRALAHFRETIYASDKLPSVYDDLTAAAEIDPNFAAALALRSMVHVSDGLLALQGGVRDRDHQEVSYAAGKHYAERALTLDPYQIPALIALSLVDLHQRQWDANLAKLEQAYILGPNEALVLLSLGSRYVRLGRVDEGVKLLDRAVALNPLDLGTHISVAWDYAFAGRWLEAKRRAREMIALAPDFAQGYADLATFSAATGDAELARTMAKKAEMLSPGPYQLLRVAWSLGRVGDTQEARRVFEVVRPEMRPESDPFWLFWLYDAIGEHAVAVDHLQLAIEGNFPIEAVDILRSHPNAPFFDGVRSDPRFQQIVDLASLPH